MIKPQILRALGYIIGVMVLVPLTIYLINFFFFKSRQVTEEYIQKYLNNSIEIQDTIKNAKISLNNDNLGSNVITKKLFLSRTHNGTLEYWGYTYYSKRYRKYIRIGTITGGWGGMNFINESILMTVNKEDFENSKYGTIENPVPVLKFVGVNRSIRPNNQDYDISYIDSFFHENVKLYLTYFMPKKEFEERFLVK